MGVSYYVVATSLIGLVGDYLFDDRKQQDRASTNRLAQELAPLYLSSQTELLQERLEAAAAELGARLMVLDMSGKVQADSESELNGSRMELPEVASILSQGKTEDYGVHQRRARIRRWMCWASFAPMTMAWSGWPIPQQGLPRTARPSGCCAVDLAHAGHDGASVHPAG